MKTLIVTGWILAGLLNVFLISNYGNKQPIGVVGIAGLVVAGPPGVVIFSAALLAKNSPCVIHCEAQ